MTENLRERLEELVDLGEAIGAENGPDSDYKRFARENAKKAILKLIRDIRAGRTR